MSAKRAKKPRRRLTRIAERLYDAASAQRLFSDRFLAIRPEDSFIAIRRNGFVYLERLVRHERVLYPNGNVVHVFEVE